jgi:hypothetical protein
MTDTPNPAPGDGGDDNDIGTAPGGAPDGRGAEIGVTEGEGSTFAPEEDPEGHGEDAGG